MERGGARWREEEPGEERCDRRVSGGMKGNLKQLVVRTVMLSGSETLSDLKEDPRLDTPNQRSNRGQEDSLWDKRGHG